MINFCLVDPTQKDCVDKILDMVKYSEKIGYAGYLEKEALRKFLDWSIYGQDSVPEWKPVDVEKIKEEIGDVKDLEVFVFPTLNKFTIEKLNCVQGFCLWKNTIILGVYGDCSVKETFYHELCHAICLNYFSRETLLDDFIFDGLAEHFVEEHLKIKSKLVLLSKEEALKIFNDVKDKLNRTDLNSELFYGTGKYPLWAGYSVGYYLVKDFR